MRKFVTLSKRKYIYLMWVFRSLKPKNIKELSLYSSFSIKVISELLQAFNYELYSELNCQEATRKKIITIKDSDSVEINDDVDSEIYKTLISGDKINKTHLADKLNISRQTLYNRINKMYNESFVQEEE